MSLEKTSRLQDFKTQDAREEEEVIGCKLLVIREEEEKPLRHFKDPKSTIVNQSILCAPCVLLRLKNPEEFWQNHGQKNHFGFVRDELTDGLKIPPAINLCCLL